VIVESSLRAKRSNPWGNKASVDCFVASLLAMTLVEQRHPQSSSPAHAGDPVRRGFSVQSLAPLEYWIARSSRATTTVGIVRFIHVIASAAKQPILSLRGKDGLLRCARNDSVQTHLRALAAPCARAVQKSLARSRAQGMPGACCTRGLACNMCMRTRTRAYRYSRSIPTFPAQWLYGLCRALPGDEFVLSPSSAE
jgi:hypothetical protein